MASALLASVCAAGLALAASRDAGAVSPPPDAGATAAWKTAPAPPPLPAPTAAGRATVDGASLAWATFGEGAPLLLLHGGAGNSSHWSNQVPAFAKHFKVVLVDTRGHGRSTRDGSPFSYALLAADVLAVMDALALDRVSIVGWSDGGIVALELALRHPERLRKVVAFAANSSPAGLKRGGGPALSAYFARCAEDHARLSPTPAGYAALLRDLRPMWRTQPSYTAAELATIRVPTLVLDGDHDEVVREDHLRALAAAIPGARLELVRDASHLAHWQQPEAFNRAVLDFLGAK